MEYRHKCYDRSNNKTKGKINKYRLRETTNTGKIDIEMIKQGQE
jgi:hypothetical protein